MASEHPRRTHPAHGIIHIPSKPTIIFDTICTKNRTKWLDSPLVYEHLRRVWQAADAWKVGKYVIMPDHIHLFVADVGTNIPYENWVRYWKSQFTKVFPCKHGGWQTDHWDTRIRSEQQLEEKWIYINENPVRHGLVSRAEDWPYRGEIFTFTWS